MYFKFDFTLILLYAVWFTLKKLKLCLLSDLQEEDDGIWA